MSSTILLGSLLTFGGQLPDEGLSALTYIYHQIEATGAWPASLQHVLIAPLPKNDECERPIGLLCTAYRLWGKMRKYLVHGWLKSYSAYADWDYAMPETSVFDCASRRQFLAEVQNWSDVSQISLLVDLKHFYDSVQLDQLAGFALQHNFPASIMHHRLVFHEAVRFLSAETVTSEGIRPKCGLVAGCPFAVYHAKLYLHDLMCALRRSVYAVPRSLATWVDDISVDCRFACERRLVAEAVAAYKTLAGGLEQLQKCISLKKSGFLCSNSSVACRLRKALRGVENAPRVHDVIKDLGLDATAGRLRRVAHQKLRRRKVARRLAKLRVFPCKARVKLMATNVLPGMLWGSQQHGIPCSQLRQLRAQMLKSTKLVKSTGSVEVVALWLLKEQQDPWYPARKLLVQNWFRLVQRGKPRIDFILEKSWERCVAYLRAVKHPWQHAKGPMSAMIATLLQLGWNPKAWDEWVTPVGQSLQINFQDNLQPAQVWKLLANHLRMAEYQSIGRGTQTPCLANGIDFTMLRKLHKKWQKSHPDRIPVLEAVVQGTFKFLDRTYLVQDSCPMCQKPHGPSVEHHRLWECPWMLSQ